jgi:OmcA/MtrC family decaheme c-type cytochrome
MNRPATRAKFGPDGRWIGLAAAALFALTVAGCGGSDGKDGAPGAPGADGQDADPTVIADLTDKVNALAQATNPETCVMCHTGDTAVARTGPNHQEIYKDFYQSGVIKISDMAFATNGVDSTTLTFKMTKKDANGVFQAFDCTKPTGNGSDFAIGSYWAEYDSVTNTFPINNGGPSPYTSLVGTKAWDAGTNLCTFSQTGFDPAVVAKMAGNGIVQLYGVDEILEVDPARHMSQGKYPFAGVLKLGTVDYESAANVSGCENCHTRPFLKHAYIYGEVLDQNGATTEFYTCKGCHYDSRPGGHVDWQILKDDPARYAEIDAGSAITDAEKAKYAYKAKLMNDVHMSHAMEFAYPQSMKNCVTCHAGKLAQVLADDKFQAETCKSCHAVDGLKEKMNANAANFDHGAILADLDGTDCTVCHTATNVPAPSFAKIHGGGYDPKIYTTTGVRYSTTFVATVDEVKVNDNRLKITFSMEEKKDIAGLSVSDVTPTVLVGLYGYDSKDFIVAAHGRDDAGNRLLEYVVGVDTNPRFALVSDTTVGAKRTWVVTANLNKWATMIAKEQIKRVEVAVLPELRNPAVLDESRDPPEPLILGLNAPSKTFDLAANAFDQKFFTDIVDVRKGCNTCHDQLATTFHSGTRGGNIKVCRMCHVVSSGGSHLELQSRSIDSYVHAVHTFQAFDPGDIDFGDPVESVEYKHHINSEFPRFGILNCESCHVPESAGGSTPGTPDVPDQAKSMPGILSGSDEVADRNIGAIPAYVTGPAVRACGACHRAQKINADDSSALAILNQHFKTFGYLVEDQEGLWDTIVAKIMGIFK